MDSQNQYQEDCPETFPVYPCDADFSLLDMLGSSRYDQLNLAVKDGVCSTYRSELFPLCDELLENEKIIGRIVPVDNLKSDEKDDDESWFKDPTTLSTFELFQAISSLQMRLEKQRKINDRTKEDIDVLSLAKSSLDLEIGFKLVELINEEKKCET